MASIVASRAHDAARALSWYQRPTGLVVIAACCVGVGFGWGQSGRELRTQEAHTPEPVPALAAATPPRPATAPPRTPSAPAVPAARDEEDADRAAAFQEQQAREIVDLLNQRLSVVSAAFQNGNPEIIAQHLRLYHAGLADGVMRAAPQLTSHLAKHVESALCDPQASPAKLMVMARLAGDTPELSSSAGFDCVFEGRNKEDIVLWTALDAWRRSGLPKTAGLEHVERMATDLRTKQRLHPELREKRSYDAAMALGPDPEEQP